MVANYINRKETEQMVRLCGSGNSAPVAVSGRYATFRLSIGQLFNGSPAWILAGNVKIINK